MNRVSTSILIVGAGPAGLAAASAASCSSRVVLLDDSPFVGGQIWRAELTRQKHSIVKSLLKAIDRKHASVLNSASVIDVVEKTAHAITPEGSLEIEFEKLIIATGARELFLPFPGWTLSGVFGAGGLQAMVKGGQTIKGKRVVVGGSGPLLIAVGEYLKRKGAKVLAIAEQAPAATINRFALSLVKNPAKLAQGIKLRLKLIGVPYLTGSWVTAAYGDKQLERANLIENGDQRSIDCDYLACGYHLVPNTEIARLLGCELDNGFVKVDDHQQTSIEYVFCAGEPTGIAGVDSAGTEGLIAGFAASSETSLALKLLKVRDTGRQFGERMSAAFALRDELKDLPHRDTVVCRCEDVEFRRLQQFTTFRDAKLQTRCGMGPCQGRVCGPATQFLFGWECPGVRPPIFPVKMEHL